MIILSKLTTGEFVVGRHVDNLLTNVALIQFNVNSMSGESGIKLVPYMHPIIPALAKIIPADKIMAMEPAPNQIQVAYLELIKTLMQNMQSQQTEDPATEKNENGDINGSD